MGNDSTEAYLEERLRRSSEARAALPVEEKLRDMDELQEAALFFRRLREGILFHDTELF
jgi:hypothetical protein